MSTEMKTLNHYNPDEHLAEFLSEFPEYEDQVTIVDMGQPVEECSEKIRALAEKRLRPAGYSDRILEETVCKVKEDIYKRSQGFEVNSKQYRAPGALLSYVLPSGGEQEGFHVVLTDDTKLTPQQYLSVSAGGFNGFLEGEGYPVFSKELNHHTMLNENTVNHEFGHLLAADEESLNFSDEGMRLQARECAPDAYAVIRHFQKYGSQSLLPQAVSDFRAIRFIYTARYQHYTSGTLDEIIKLGAAGKLQGLSPRESIKLAVDVTSTTVYDLKKSQVLCHAFKQAKKRRQESLGIVIQDFANVTGMKRESIEIPQFPIEDSINILVDDVEEIGVDTKNPAVKNAALHFFDAVERWMPEDNPRFDKEKLLSAREKVQMGCQVKPVSVDKRQGKIQRLLRRFGF